MKFNMRIGDLEARSCDEHLLLSGEHDRIEIIRWQSKRHIPEADREEYKEYCYTIAYFKPTTENWDLIMLPDRYIEIIQNRKLQKLFDTLVMATYDFLLSLREEEDD